MIQGLMSFLTNGTSWDDPQRTGQNRIRRYLIHKRLYDGYAIREDTTRTLQYKKLKFNLAHPIINKSADFLASRPISFWIPGNNEATEKCKEIWSKSGSGSTFMESAILASIMGDAVVMACKGEKDDVAYIKWLDPGVCFPEFNSHNYEQMDAMVFMYQIPLNGGGIQKYYEEWRDGTITIKVDDKVVSTDTWDVEAFGGVPLEWIRNMRVKGEIYGRSDVQNVVELIEEYDHLASKQSRILDYHMAPNIVVKGVPKGRLDVTKGERTVYHLPTDGSMEFLNANIDHLAVKDQLDRIKESISEVTETPQIAFSKIDHGIRDVTGVAIKLLYGPLLSKTDRKRASWTPPLIRAMKKALIIEGIDVDEHDISILWQSPLPSNDLEDWQISSIKETLGVSHAQILRERGYTDEQIEKMRAEKDSEQESAGATSLKQFNSGKVSNPYNEPKDKSSDSKEDKSEKEVKEEK